MLGVTKESHVPGAVDLGLKFVFYNKRHVATATQSTIQYVFEK